MQKLGIYQVSPFFWLLFLVITYTPIKAQYEGGFLSPYQAIYNHIHHLEDQNYNLSQSAKSFPERFSLVERQEMAQKLKIILDSKGLVIDYTVLPKNPDFMDSITLDHRFFPFPLKYPALSVVKINEEWKYSIETSLDIESSYRSVMPIWSENLLQRIPSFMHKKIFNITIWQYAGIFILILCTWLINYLLSYIVDLIILRLLYKNENLEVTHSKTVYKMANYISLVILVFFLKYFIGKLLLPSNISSVIISIMDIFQTVFILLLIFQIIALLKIYLTNYTAKTESKLDDQLVPVFSKGLKVIFSFIAFLHILALMGVNITALIAGASIGGLALALAAQDTFKNMFGSIMVFLDQPFQIGDFIITSEIEGTVASVGLRSTRIRKIDTSIISVPNGNLANTTVTNLGKRMNRIVEFTIGILYSTERTAIKNFVDLLRTIPAKHQAVSPENQFIYLRNLGNSSIDIYFRIYVEVHNLEEELKARELIIYDIIKAAEESGVSFAFPSSSVYIEPTEITKTWIKNDKP